jgi:hypothetical protein
MADEYDPFNLRKHPGYYAELVQERDPTHDVAASYVKNHQYDGGILGQLERNPHGLGDSPLPFDPTGAELRSTSEGGSAFTERPKDHLQPVAELISPTLGAFGAGQMAGTAYKEAGEGDYQEAGMSLAPLLAGMVVPGAPKGARGPRTIRPLELARGMRSDALEVSKLLPQEEGTVGQFRSMLLSQKGYKHPEIEAPIRAKPKELEAIGFDRAFPDPNAKMTRAQLEQYLRDNRVQLGEEVYGNSSSGKDQYGNEFMGAPKYSNYSTPGGDGYREVVTKLPSKEQGDIPLGPRGWNDAHNANSAAGDVNYQSSHWPGITNPVLHYRQKDFLNHADPTSVGALEKVTQPPGQLQRGLAGEPGYAYHATNTDRLREIADSGELRTHEPHQFTDQDMWPDGAIEPRSYFGASPEHLWQFAPEEGTPTAIRTRMAPNIRRERGTNDLYSRDPIGVDALEYLGADNAWHPVSSLRQNGSGDLGPLSGKPGAMTDTSPSKTRVLDEMQSDWAQRARDQGTRDPAAVAGLKKQFAETQARHYELKELVEPEFTAMLESKGTIGMPPAKQALWDELRDTGDSMMDLQNKIEAAQNGVPSAPYISNTSDWVDLGLKQALIDAAKDPSVNRLAWAPGKVQADRYNLAKDISGLRYDPDRSALYYQKAGGGKNDWVNFGEAVAPDKLSDYIGKDAAAALLASPRVNVPHLPKAIQAHSLDMPPGTTLGGEGMKSFYGDMTPEGYQSGIVGTRLQKLVKGLDPEAAKIESHELTKSAAIRGPNARGEWVVASGGNVLSFPTEAKARAYLGDVSKGDTYPSIPITPAMREKILKEGLPLFNIAALSALVSRILGQGQPDTEGEDGGGF